MLTNIDNLMDLSTKFSIPMEDLLFLDLNIEGINVGVGGNRIRFGIPTTENTNFFKESIKNNINAYYGAYVSSKSNSIYSLNKNNVLYMNNYKICKVGNPLPNFCESSYLRQRSRTVNLNPIVKSKCTGCKFCHIIGQVPHEIIKLNNEHNLELFILKYLRRTNSKDLINLDQIAIVTGCFKSEQLLSNYLILLKNVFSKYKFRGEIMYFGSQTKSKSTLKYLKEKIGNFTYCFTLECFERGKELLNFIKSSISLDDIKNIMMFSKSIGINITFSYIIGLEKLNIVEKYFNMFKGYITKFPIINIYQIHINQENLRENTAETINYYIYARKILENIFYNTYLRPNPWENYRPLWYLKFGYEIIKSDRLPFNDKFEE